MAKTFKVGHEIRDYESYIRSYHDFFNSLDNGDLMRVQCINHIRAMNFKGWFDEITDNDIVDVLGYIHNILKRTDLGYRYFLSVEGEIQQNRGSVESFSLSPIWPIKHNLKIDIKPSTRLGTLQIGDFDKYCIFRYELLESQKKYREDKILVASMLRK